MNEIRIALIEQVPNGKELFERVTYVKGEQTAKALVDSLSEQEKRTLTLFTKGDYRFPLDLNE